jgi:hypothetical protein
MDRRIMTAERPWIDCGTASRALIGLIAELAWAERQPGAGASIRSIRVTRDEAFALLPRIELGDREAARRAMELVSARGARAA